MGIGRQEEVVVVLERTDLLDVALRMATAITTVETLGESIDHDHEVPLVVNGKEVLAGIMSYLVWLHTIRCVELQVSDRNGGRHLYIVDYTDNNVWVPRQTRLVLTPEEDILYRPAQNW